MKANRKSTMIAYWTLRVLAISCALLLFSVTGIIARQTVTHTTVLAAQSDGVTSGITLSPADGSMSPTPTPTLTPTNTPTPDPTPTSTPTPMPTSVPTKMATKPPISSPTPTPMLTPIAGVTPTSTATTGGSTLPPPVAKGTSKAKPSPTPPGSPTPGTSSTQVPTIPGGNTPATPKTQSGSGGLMAMVKPLIWPIAGVGSTILLSSAGLLGLLFWRKRAAGQTAAARLQSSSAQASVPSMNEQPVASNGYYKQSTEATLAQKQPMIPSAMQSIAQYSPLLGSPDSSHLDAPVPPPASDFRPLPLDFPQILEVNTDKMPVPILSTRQILSPTTDAEFQSALQLVSTPLSSIPDAGSPSTPTKTPIPPAQQNASIAYHFPLHDSSLENLMHQAQMGIFAIPDKQT